MGIRASARRISALVGGGATLLAGGALYLSLSQGEAARFLFRQVLTIEVMAALLVSSAAAWAARRVTVGRKLTLRGTWTEFYWIVSRLAFLGATGLLIIVWFASLALGVPEQRALVRAVVLVVVVAAFNGIAGGAVFNAMAAVRHRRAGADNRRQ